MGVNILGVDVLGVDILKLDVMALPHFIWVRVGAWDYFRQTAFLTKCHRSVITEKLWKLCDMHVSAGNHTDITFFSASSTHVWISWSIRLKKLSLSVISHRNQTQDPLHER